MMTYKLTIAILSAALASISPVALAQPGIISGENLELASTRTQLGLLLDNPKTKAVLEQSVPEMLAVPQLRAAKGQTLRGLSKYIPQMLPPSKLAELDGKLAQTNVMFQPTPMMASATGDPFKLEAIRLWPDRAPGAKADNAGDVPSLTIVRPDGALSSKSAVIIAPGGGYNALSEVSEGRLVADWFAARGVTAFVLRYRLASVGYVYPTQLLDMQRAVRLVRSHARDYDIDPGKVGVMGFSAGGHLAAMTETLFTSGDGSAVDPVERVSSRPDFAVLIYPGIAMNRPGWSASVIAGPHPDAATVKALSPAENVSAQTPPTFLVHATGDSLIPSTDSTTFYNAMRAENRPAELHIFDGGRHGFGLGQTDGKLAAWPSLLNSWLEARKLIIASPTYGLNP